MQINVLFFGSFAALAGNTMVVEGVQDLRELERVLIKRVPLLRGKKYALAVNQIIVHDNILLTDNCTVALLPPFSGG